MPQRVHHGLAIKRLREIRGFKQEALALELGDEWNQRRVSLLEGRESIEFDLLQRVAAALQVPVESIENFCENTVLQSLGGKAVPAGKEPETAPFPSAALLLESLLEAVRENKALYERLLQSEKEKIDLLRELFLPNDGGNGDRHTKRS
ncbi:MAG TPA: helix-turn-helix transcriptional regulator [Flavisolibacter sp.]|nr:helix-turn-helix transcriptional regulator [Flavisolibacter sp.]